MSIFLKLTITQNPNPKRAFGDAPPKRAFGAERLGLPSDLNFAALGLKPSDLNFAALGLKPSGGRFVDPKVGFVDSKSFSSDLLPGAPRPPTPRP